MKTTTDDLFYHILLEFEMEMKKAIETQESGHREKRYYAGKESAYKDAIKTINKSILLFKQVKSEPIKERIEDYPNFKELERKFNCFLASGESLTDLFNKPEPVTPCHGLKSREEILDKYPLGGTEIDNEEDWLYYRLDVLEAMQIFHDQFKQEGETK